MQKWNSNPFFKVMRKRKFRFRTEKRKIKFISVFQSDAKKKNKKQHSNLFFKCHAKTKNVNGIWIPFSPSHRKTVGTKVHAFRLKSTTTNGWRHFGQSEQRKSSILFPIQSEKSPDSGFFTCDPTKKCIMPSSRGDIGRGHDLRLHKIQYNELITVITGKWIRCRCRFQSHLCSSRICVLRSIARVLKTSRNFVEFDVYSLNGNFIRSKF